MKRKRFNWCYNNDETIGFGKGYYIYFEGHDGSIMIDSYYKSWEYNEQVDVVSVGILNKFKDLYYLGYQLDMYLAVNLKDLF